MINLTDTTGLASSATAMAAAALLLPGFPRIPKSYRIGLAGAVAIAALLPFGGLPLAAYVRGVTGDLSITSLVLLVLAILQPLLGWRSSAGKDSFALQLLITVAALGLYPLALGLGYFDPYRLGYGNPWFLCVLLVAALAACFRQLPLVALCIALSVVAWGIGWYESNNLWDYLLDPLLSVYAVSAVMRHSVQTLLK